MVKNIVQNLIDEDWSSKIDRIILERANPYERKGYFNRYFLISEKVVKLFIRGALDNTDKKLQIIDAATGDGSGAAFLAEQHPDWSVLGIDIDEQAIQYAIKNYKRTKNMENLEYKCRNIIDIEEKADVFVSMETLEHIQKDLMYDILEKISSQILKPGGKLVVSMPRLRPRESTKKRPGHINELYYQEFKYTLGEHFPVIEFYSFDRYGNVIADTQDANLMVGICTKWPSTRVFFNTELE